MQGKQEDSLGKSKRYRYLNFYGACFAVAVSISTSSEYQQKSVFQQLPKRHLQHVPLKNLVN